jgi:uncharacterized NAD(P)/FAD-binding protein YdhS
VQENSETLYDVAIVGGGFSGVALAMQLLVQSGRQLRIAAIDRFGTLGQGVAYGTEYDEHILNVPAGNMGAFPDHPGHFYLWLSEIRQHPAAPGQFVSRSLYAEYLDYVLNETLRKRPPSVFTPVTGAVQSIRIVSEKLRLELGSGERIIAQAGVLACGNAPPVDPPQLKGITNGAYISNAWARDALKDISPTGKVLILGCGLTAIDQVVALTAKNFGGEIVMLSRRGQLPPAHEPCEAWPSDWSADLPASARCALASVREQIRHASSDGVDWRAVIDSMRQYTQQLWRRWPLEERRRFLRHVRPFWELARHRTPPPHHELLKQLISAGTLRIIAGRLLTAKAHKDHLEITIQQRCCEREEVLRIDRVLNCTGPGTTHRTQDELIVNLVHDGLACIDPLGIGLETDDNGAVISVSGIASPHLYAIGPMRKATLWETTAVREIRAQAQELALHLIKILDIKSLSVEATTTA